MTILKAENLYKEFNYEGNICRVINGMNLTVEEGQFLSIMGQSGSGKSTLLYLLSGLQKPTSGRVVLENQDLSTLNDRTISLLRRRKLGFVFQFYNLLPTLTVEENITLPLELDGVKKKEFTKSLNYILEVIGLEDKRSCYPYQLSGGQQQRTAIGRALITNPKIIFADEPTGNLDSKTGEEVLQLLRQLSKEKGKTILMVTHDSQAASFSDNIINIKDGIIVDGAGTSFGVGNISEVV